VWPLPFIDPMVLVGRVFERKEAILKYDGFAGKMSK
jgi:hypothetical protein